MLRLFVDLRWNADQWSALFRCLDELHNHVSLHLQYSVVRPGQVYAFGPGNPPPDSRFELQVNAIQFASPGWTDLSGIAGSLKEIRELVQWAIERWGDRKFRKIALEKEIAERDLLRIEVAERLIGFLGTLETSNMPKQADRHFKIVRKGPPNIDALIDAIIEHRLVGTETLKKGSEE